MKFLKNDEVIITLGKDKGKTGKIEAVLTKENKVVVPGVNEFKRHIKGRMQGQKSEIITITKPIVVSKLALVCPKCHKPTRIGYTTIEGKKVRVCKKCDKQI